MIDSQTGNNILTENHKKNETLFKLKASYVQKELFSKQNESSQNINFNNSSLNDLGSLKVITKKNSMFVEGTRLESFKIANHDTSPAFIKSATLVNHFNPCGSAIGDFSKNHVMSMITPEKDFSNRSDCHRLLTNPELSMKFENSSNKERQQLSKNQQAENLIKSLNILEADNDCCNQKGSYCQCQVTP